MHEDILAAAILRYETEPLLRVVPFNCTETLPLLVTSVGPAPGRCEEGREAGRRSALLVTWAVLVTTSMTSAT
jgi:hypothetical protein